MAGSKDIIQRRLSESLNKIQQYIIVEKNKFEDPDNPAHIAGYVQRRPVLKDPSLIAFDDVSDMSEVFSYLIGESDPEEFCNRLETELFRLVSLKPLGEMSVSNHSKALENLNDIKSLLSKASKLMEKNYSLLQYTDTSDAKSEHWKLLSTLMKFEYSTYPKMLEEIQEKREKQRSSNKTAKRYIKDEGLVGVNLLLRDYYSKLDNPEQDKLIIETQKAPPGHNIIDIRVATAAEGYPLDKQIYFVLLHQVVSLVGLNDIIKPGTIKTAVESTPDGEFQLPDYDLYDENVDRIEQAMLPSEDDYLAFQYEEATGQKYDPDTVKLVRSETRPFNPEMDTLS